MTPTAFRTLVRPAKARPPGQKIARTRSGVREHSSPRPRSQLANLPARDKPRPALAGLCVMKIGGHRICFGDAGHSQGARPGGDDGVGAHPGCRRRSPRLRTISLSLPAPPARVSTPVAFFPPSRVPAPVPPVIAFTSALPAPAKLPAAPEKMTFSTFAPRALLPGVVRTVPVPPPR
jgi:hypothetical protein